MKTDAERLEKLEAVLLRLREVAVGATLVVEGSRDEAALSELGIEGHVVRVHGRRPLQEVVDAVAEGPGPVVLLLDWDRTGARLAGRIAEQLVGRITVEPTIRKALIEACRAKCLEDVPAELAFLRRPPRPI